ncbi:MAG: hypothetical protein JJ974_06110 [Phycisphaerales bacterium]|nr:hypothetical protein [Phycisphaerales bacterium]
MCENQFYKLPRSQNRIMIVGLVMSILASVVCAERSDAGDDRRSGGDSGLRWSQGMLWYQVFPERFANGNPRNDPLQERSTLVDWETSFDDASIEEVERAWMLQAGEPRRFRYHPGLQGGSAANVIFKRRYGGDLQGVITHLDHLHDLGIQGIYLCPIFTSTSLHKYDAADHRHIDPTLGHPGANPSVGVVRFDHSWDPSDESTWDWTESDRWFVETFIREVHSRGMRIMLDGVWNHVGVDHWAFRDVIEQGEESEFAGWFEVEFDEDGKLAGWKSWNGWSGGLPVFKQTPSGDLAPGPKAHMMAVTRRWMDPNGDGDPSDGIDGWRLDVANEIGRPFWKDWRALVKELNPEALIVGEIWFDAREYFDGTAFDAQMNYPMAYAVSDWLSIGHMKGDARSLAGRLTEVYSHELETDLRQLNLMTSHDTERLGSLLENDFQRGFDRDAHPWRDAYRYEKHTVNDEAMVKALVANLVMVVNPGSVMVYNGDEFMMPGADDPDNRRPIPTAYLDESGLSDRQEWYLNELRWIFSLIRDPEIGDTLRFGLARWESDPDSKILRIERTHNGQRVVVDIGPADSQWEPWILNSAPLLKDHIFQRGSESWRVRIGLQTD